MLGVVVECEREATDGPRHQPKMTSELRVTKVAALRANLERFEVEAAKHELNDDQGIAADTT